MDRCPNCHKFGVEVNQNGTEQCLWIDCLWVNKENIDLSKVEHPLQFTKFAESIKQKTSIG